MAKFLSQVYSTIRGSVGGITYTANQFQSLIARARVSPVNPNTPKQTMMRSSFSGASARWLAATDAVRTAWNDYALTCTYEGPLGTYSIPGRQMFISNISTALYLTARGVALEAITDAAPVVPGFLNPEDVAPVVPIIIGTGIRWSMGNHTGEEIYGYSERSVSWNPTRYRFKGPFLTETLDAIEIPDNTLQNLEFTGLAEDMIYFTNPRAISGQPPFRMSSPFYLRHVAETIVI